MIYEEKNTLSKEVCNDMISWFDNKMLYGDTGMNYSRVDVQGRKEILKVHLKNKKVKGETDLEELSVLTTGFSGADIANLANEAAILSVRKNLTSIDRKTFLDAYEKITIG